MPITLSFKVDDSQVKTMMSILPGAIRDELDVAIYNSINKVKETINSDYKRMGNLYPSYLNPSTSGLGFTDRTGTLRASIQAWIEQKATQTVGYVSAGTDYDKYVELLWSGKYSFMLPAFLQEQNYILGEIGDAVARAVSAITVI